MSKLVAEPTKPQYKIFDDIVNLPVIRIIKPIYEWKRSLWIYCFLGFLATVVDFGCTAILRNFIDTATIITAISFSVSLVESFATYRYLYFDRTNNSFMNEFLKFAPTRTLTFLLDELSMFIFVDTLGINIWIIKTISIPVITIINYFTSKLFVFKDTKKSA